MNKSIETLKRFNAWRTGEDDRTMDEAGIVPSEVTKAIDDVIEQHAEMVKLLVRSRLELEQWMEATESDDSEYCVKKINEMLERTK